MMATPDSDPAMGPNVQNLLQNTVNKIIVSGRPDSENREHHATSLANSPTADKKRMQQSPYSSALGYFSLKRRLNESLTAGSHDGRHESTNRRDNGRSDVLSEGPASDVDGDDLEMAITAKNWLQRVAANGKSHMEQLEQELGVESARSDEAPEEIQIPEPRHVKYATVMAKNLRRNSQRATMTAKAHRHSVEARMTPQARKELTLAQREVMWNLQREGVVTVVRPGDNPVPYKRQGNPAVNTPQCIRRRHALRNNSLIQEISNEYWCFPGLNPDGSGEMKKESYMQLNRKLHLALDPDTTDEEARRSAEVDWLRDTKKWGGRMPQDAFFSSMFELTDIWTENIDDVEYTAFLWLLLETITDTNIVPPSFKSDQDIECIAYKDISKRAAQIRSAFADDSKRRNMLLPRDIDTINAALATNGGDPGEDTLSPQLKDKHIQRLRALRQRLEALKQLRTGSLEGVGTADRGEVSMHGGGDTIEGVGTTRAKGNHCAVLSDEDLDVYKSLVIQEKHADSLSGDHDFLLNAVRFDSLDVSSGDEYTACDRGDTRRTKREERYGVDEFEGPDGVLQDASTSTDNKPRPKGRRSIERQTLVGSQNNSNQAPEYEFRRSESVQPSFHVNQQETHGLIAGNRLGEKEPTVSGENSHDSGQDDDNKHLTPMPLRGSDVLKQQNRACQASGTLVFDGRNVTSTAKKLRVDGARANGEPSACDLERENVDNTRHRQKEAVAGDVMVQVGTPISLLSNVAAHQTRSNPHKETGMQRNAENEVSLARPGDTSAAANSAPTTSKTATCAGISGGTDYEAEGTSHLVSGGLRNLAWHVSEHAGTEAAAACDTYRPKDGGGCAELGFAQQNGAQTISLDPSSALVSAILPRRAEGTFRDCDGQVNPIQYAVEMGKGGTGGMEHPSKNGKHRRRQGRDNDNDAGGRGEQEKTKTPTKGREFRSTMDDTDLGGPFMGSRNLDAGDLSVVKNSESEDWMIKLMEEEKGDWVPEVDGRETKTGEAIAGYSQETDERGSGVGTAKDSSLESPSVLRPGRQVSASRKEQHTKRSMGNRHTEIGGRNDGTTRLQTSSEIKSGKPSHFRPAGGNAGWDGITGTTDEAWAVMIEQAKEQRRAASSRSQTKRAAPAKHTTRESSILKCSSASSSTTEATKSARASLVERTPDLPGKRLGGGVVVNTDFSPRTEQDEESAYSKRRIGGARSIEQGYGRANMEPKHCFQTGKRRKANESTVDPTNQKYYNNKHKSEGNEIAGQQVKRLVLKGSEESPSNTRQRDYGFKQPRKAVVAGERAAGHLEDPKLHGKKSLLEDETRVSVNIGLVAPDDERKSQPDNPGIRNAEISDIDNGGAPMRKQSGHAGIQIASNDTGHGALKSDRAGHNAHGLGEAQAVANVSATHQQRLASDVDGLSTVSNLRASTNAIARLHEVLANYNMTLHDLLYSESSESLDRMGGMGEASFDKQEPPDLPPEHRVSSSHDNFVLHNLMANRGDCSDKQSSVDSPISQRRRVAPAPDAGKKSPKIQPVSPTVADGNQVPDAAVEPAAMLSQDSGASVEDGVITSNGCGPEVVIQGRRVQRNQTLIGDGELVSKHGAVLRKSRDGDIEFPDGRADASMGTLFFDSAGGVVAGVTNDIPTKGRGLIWKRPGVHRFIDGNHSQGSIILDSKPSPVMTIDQNLVPRLGKEQGACTIARVKGGEPGVQVHEDLVADGVSPWGASMSIGGMHSEIVDNCPGIPKLEVDNQPGAIMDTCLNRVMGAGYRNTADRVHPSAPPITPADVDDSSSEMCAHGCTPLASISDDLVESHGTFSSRKTSNQADPCLEQTSSRVPLFKVDRDDGVTQAQGEEASIATWKSSPRPHLEDQNERSMLDAYYARPENIIHRGGYEGGTEGTTSSQYERTPSDVQFTHGHELSWARPGFWQGGMHFGASFDRDDVKQGANVVMERNVEPGEGRQTIAGRIEGWPQYHPPTGPEIRSAGLTTRIPTRSSSRSLEAAERVSEGELVLTKAGEPTTGSDSAEFRGAHVPVRNHTIRLKAHPPLEDIAQATTRYVSAQVRQAEYEKSDNSACGPGQQGHTPLLATVLSQEDGKVEIQADEPPSLIHTKTCARDGDPAALPWTPLQRENSSARVVTKTTAASDDDKCFTGGAAERLPDDVLHLESFITVDKRRKLVSSPREIDGNCNENIQWQRNGERDMGNIRSGPAEVDHVVSASVNNNLLPGMVTLVAKNSPILGNDHIVSDRQEAIATIEGKVGLSCIDEARTSGDGLARTVARRIARTGGGRYENVLAEVTQALAGVEDSSLVFLKKIYEETGTEATNTITVAKSVALGAPTEEIGKRDRKSAITSAARKIASRGQGGSTILTGKGKSEQDTSTRLQRHRGKENSWPQTAGKHHQSGPGSTVSTYNGKGNQHFNGKVQHNHADSDDSQPMKDHNDTGSIEWNLARDTARRSPSPQRGVQSTRSGSKRRSAESTPRNKATAVNKSSQRGSLRNGPPADVHAFEETKERDQAQGKTGIENRGKPPWRGGYPGAAHERTVVDGEHVFGDPKHHSDIKHYVNPTTVESTRIRGGKIMPRDRWIDDIYAHRPARPRTADSVRPLRQNHHRNIREAGDRRAHDEREQPRSEECGAQNQKSSVQGKEENLEHWNHIGHQHNFPPPQRIDRPRTSPVITSAEQQDREDRRGFRQSHGSSTGTSQGKVRWCAPGIITGLETTAGGYRPDDSYMQSRDYRERRKSFPLGRPRNEQPEDSRPLWRAGTPPSTYFGWRDPHSEGPRVTENSGEPHPYYVDPTQIKHYIPTLGLPPWRTPAPGEPGWEPILNYCEVKRDKDEAIQEQKRRNYLVQRRRESRRCGGASNEESISLGESSDGSINLPLQQQEAQACSMSISTGEQQEDDDDISTAVTAIARRVNAQHRPGPSNLREESASGVSIINTSELVTWGDHSSPAHSRGEILQAPRDSAPALRDAEGRRDSSRRHQDGDAGIDGTAGRRSLLGNVVKVADLARQASDRIELTSRSGAFAATNGRARPSAVRIERPATHEVQLNGDASFQPLLLEAVQGHGLRGEIVGSPQKHHLSSASPPRLIGGQRQNVQRSLKSKGNSNRGSMTFRDSEGFDVEKGGEGSKVVGAASEFEFLSRSEEENAHSPVMPSSVRSRSSLLPGAPDAAYGGGDSGSKHDTAQGILVDHHTKLAAMSSTGVSLPRPLTQLLPVADPIPTPSVEITGKASITQNATTTTRCADVGAPIADKESSTFSAGGHGATIPSSGQRRRQRSFIAAVTPSLSGCGDSMERIPCAKENTRNFQTFRARRRSSLPITALAEVLEHRRRSELLMKSLSAIAASASPSDSPPRTSIPGSRWAQDVRLRQHIEGRSRLAPATRTAGGRRGSNHGRLRSLLPGEGKLAMATAPAFSKRWGRESGQWVLDTDPRLHGSSDDEVRYPLFQKVIAAVSCTNR